MPIEPTKEEEDKWKKGKGPKMKERVLILWDDLVRIYCVANPLGSEKKKENEKIKEMRCALLLKVPQAAMASIDGAAAKANADGGGGGDSATRRFWLVGTALDELHLLTEELSPAKLHQATPRTDGSRGVRLSQLQLRGGGSQHVEEAPLGIASLAAVGDPDKVPEHPTAPEAAALCVGFDDGSVRQYSIKELLAAF